MDRDDFLRGYLNNFRNVREREFVRGYLESMNPDDPDIFLPDNPKEYIPIFNYIFQCLIDDIIHLGNIGIVLLA